jgi:anti-sigma B factor antagonist
LSRPAAQTERCGRVEPANNPNQKANLQAAIAFLKLSIHQPTVPEELQLEVRTEVVDGIIVHRITGKIDTLTSPNFESAIRSSLSGDGPRVILDMREVSFISSAGIRVLAMAARRTAATQGGLAVFGLNSTINEVLEISGLQKMIPIAANETEARAKLGK